MQKTILIQLFCTFLNTKGGLKIILSTNASQIFTTLISVFKSNKNQKGIRYIAYRKNCLYFIISKLPNREYIHN